jgi:ribonucleoside-diphosphate reductase alpha chain
MTVEMGSLAQAVYKQKYEQHGEGWEGTAKRVVDAVMRPYFPSLADETEQLIRERKFLPGGRYLYAAGRPMNQVNNCLLLKVEDSREGWASLMRRVTEGLMTGAGIGVDYSALRHNGAEIKGTGGESTGPLALMQMVNEAGRHIRQGGSRRSALWAGLNWKHKDIFDFIHMKDWSDDIKAAKEKDFNSPAPMDGTNISVLLDDEFFQAYKNSFNPLHEHAHRVYDETVENMLFSGEPGFSVDVGENRGETLRNACTELTSADDNDICNLGSLNLARIKTLEEFNRAVELATAFLICGTLYSKVPFEEVAATRDKNRRLGLGLMGLAEWLAQRGYTYSPNSELKDWLEVYSKSGYYADSYADGLGISRPVKTRAIAPAGTISIVAETTSGMEPIFAAAYRRRYLKGDTWYAQYTIDASAERLAAQGIDPDSLDTASTLAADPTARVRMQAFLQRYVDHGISSTINLPSYAEQEFTPEQFGNMLISYLPYLRGITCYPNGSRGGQPLTAISYAEAKDKAGVEVVETGNEEACVGGVCGI